MKICKKCKEEKELNEFYASRAVCKKCVTKRLRIEYRQKYPLSKDKKKGGGFGSGKRLNLLNKKFNLLTAIKQIRNDKYNNCQWLCKCECGGQKIVIATDLKNNNVKSCGCLSIGRPRLDRDYKIVLSCTLRRIENGGYIYFKKPNHPNRNCQGYVPEHRLIMEKHLNRYLTKKEISFKDHFKWWLNNFEKEYIYIILYQSIIIGYIRLTKEITTSKNQNEISIAFKQEFQNKGIGSYSYWIFENYMKKLGLVFFIIFFLII